MIRTAVDSSAILFIKPPVTGIDPSAKSQGKQNSGLGGIGANVVIGICEIGDNTVIMHNSVIHDGVKVDPMY